MDRREAHGIAGEILAGAGRSDVLAELRRALEAAEAAEGQARSIAEVTRDITARENAEVALARSEESYRTLIEGMAQGVVVHRQGTMVLVNPAARAMLGYGPDDQLVGEPLLDMIHPDDRPMVAERIREMATRAKMLPPVEERLLRKDGSCFVAEVTAFRTVFDGEPSVIVIACDVTARKELDAQIVMNDRLASIGRLAASVGHELNNPLAYVLGNVTMLERELQREGRAQPALSQRLATHVEMIKEGAMRMRDIVNDLKTLARGEGTERVPIDMQPLLDVCANMAEHEIRGRARLVKEYRDKAWVQGTEARFGQVFLNLLVNAAQAIPEHREDNEIRIVLYLVEGRRVVVEIHDTGEGIAPENQARIFEPFFTTKHVAGTGLGLPVSRTIVKAAGGTISAEERPGGGTIFRVVLPAAE